MKANSLQTIASKVHVPVVVLTVLLAVGQALYEQASTGTLTWHLAFTVALGVFAQFVVKNDRQWATELTALTVVADLAPAGPVKQALVATVEEVAPAFKAAELRRLPDGSVQASPI